MHETLHESSASSSGLTLNDIVTRYSDLFDGTVGCMATEIHLELNPKVPEVQMPLRRLPVALRDQVKAELDQTVANKVITPLTEPTVWVNALLVVQKPEGQDVHICIDPKFLNQALQRSTFYMQCIDDILPQLGNVKVLLCVDIKHAFWSLQLDRVQSAYDLRDAFRSISMAPSGDGSSSKPRNFCGENSGSTVRTLRSLVFSR